MVFVVVVSDNCHLSFLLYVLYRNLWFQANGVRMKMNSFTFFFLFSLWSGRCGIYQNMVIGGKVSRFKYGTLFSKLFSILA